MRIVTTVCVLLASCALAMATQLHMGPSQQYENIQAAMQAAEPGDTIMVHAGTYSTYQMVESKHGANGKWIVVKRYADDEVVINGMWQFSKVTFMKFQGLSFRGSTQFPGRLFLIDNGGNCATQSKNIVVDSCSFMNTTDTVYAVFKYAGVDSFTVSNCVFKDLAAGAMDYNSCHYGRITANRIENCLTGGHIKGGASLITMDRNLFLNASRATWVAFELGGDTSKEFYCEGTTAEVRDLRFYANLVIGGYRGIALSSAVNCQVVNNTFYEQGQATLRFLTTSKLYPALSGNYVVNNILAFGAQSQYINGSQQSFGAVIMAHNLYYSTTNPSFTGPYWDTPALDAIKEIDPLIVSSTTKVFVDGAQRDLHLADGSPAIGIGLKMTDPVADYYGYAYKDVRSVGAAEYGSSPVSVSDANADPMPPFNVAIVPNPASSELRVVTTDVDTQWDVRIMNTCGTEVFRGTVAGLQGIDCSLQPAGMYLVHVAPLHDGAVQRRTFPLMILR